MSEHRKLGGGAVRVVDSSVWIDYFNGRDTVVRLELRRLLLLTLSVELCGGADIALAAAEHCRHLRARGITVHSNVDVVIAAFCIDRDYLLLHTGRDYDALATHRGLHIWRQ